MIKYGNNRLDIADATWLQENGAAQSIYASAYTVTNEDLRNTVRQSDGAKSVLTIAGSGDQSLFYKLGGAEHIDTFDITFCAAAIQEIKYAALRMNVPYLDYINLLAKLQWASDLTTVKYMPEILNQINPDAAYFIREMKNQPIFSAGSLARQDSTMLTHTEYNTLQSMQLPTPNFIWSDASRLNFQLNKTYDVINLSNIFDRNPDILPQTIISLAGRLRPNGRIVFESHDPISDELFKRTTSAEPLKSFGKITETPQRDLLIFQRTR